MQGLFVITYVLLCAILLCLMVLLRRLVAEVNWYKRFYRNQNHQDDLDVLPMGTEAPKFSGRLLGTQARLTTDDLKNHPSILLFVSTAEEQLPEYEGLNAGIHTMWHKTDGRTYLVCNGSEESCRRLAKYHHVPGFKDNQVPIVLDEGGSIARRFMVRTTPQAVELDRNARVRRYGRPLHEDGDGKLVDERSSITNQPLAPQGAIPGSGD